MRKGSQPQACRCRPQLPGQSGPWGGRTTPGRPSWCLWWAHLANIRQMSRQVSRGSAGEYQADEPAVVARLSWQISGR